MLAFALGERRRRSRPSSASSKRCSPTGVDRATPRASAWAAASRATCSASPPRRTCGAFRYAHVATSLVAMVDAAIGGKTGVDLRCRKETWRACFAIRVPSSATCGALDDAADRVTCAKAWRKSSKRRSSRAATFFESLENARAASASPWPWESVVARRGAKSRR